MIFVTEAPSDFLEGMRRQLPAQVHRHAPGLDGRSLALCPAKLQFWNVEKFADGALNFVDRRISTRRRSEDNLRRRRSLDDRRSGLERRGALFDRMTKFGATVARLDLCRG